MTASQIEEAVEAYFLLSRTVLGVSCPGFEPVSGKMPHISGGKPSQNLTFVIDFSRLFEKLPRKHRLTLKFIYDDQLSLRAAGRILNMHHTQVSRTALEALQTLSREARRRKVGLTMHQALRYT